MEPYRIVIAPSARKSLLPLPPKRQRSIEARIDALAGEPRPKDCTKLTGLAAYRIRSGDYRIVYVVDDVQRVVSILRVGHRRGVYRRL